MKITIIFFALVLTTIFNIVNSATTYDVHYIISAKVNGTAANADLSQEDKDYVFFSFDFELHNQEVPESKDLAYFEISSSLNLLKDKSLGVGFYEGPYTDIKATDDIKDYKYEDTKAAYYENADNDNKYYYKIKRSDTKKKTLLLRVPKTGFNEGGVMVENVLSIPGGSDKGGNGKFLFPKIFATLLLILSIL